MTIAPYKFHSKHPSSPQCQSRHQDGLQGLVHFSAAFRAQRKAASVVHFASAIHKVCVQFVALCRQMGLLTNVAIDGSKFKAVNNRDKNFTRAKMERRLAQIDQSVARDLSQLDTADLQEPSEALAAKTAHLKEKLAKLRERAAALESN